MSENGIEAVRTVTGDERHDMRLMTLLRSMVREKLLKGAAETPGVDPRTVQTSMERGELSDLVRVALERHVLADSDEKAAEQRERIDALERRLDALEMEIRSDPEDGRKAINEECQTFREEQVGASNQQAKSHPKGVDEDKGAPDENHAKENRALGKRRMPRVLREPRPQRRMRLRGRSTPSWDGGCIPSCCTRSPGPTMSKSTARHGPSSPSGASCGRVIPTMARVLSWLRTEERIRALEVAMLEEHGLTLPPEKQPLYGLDRRDQLIWRKETLREVRRALAWRILLRRILTCGIRWN